MTGYRMSTGYNERAVLVKISKCSWKCFVYGHFLRGDSRAVLGAVGCENSFHFASKSTLIQSIVPGALQCPNHLGVDRRVLGAKL